MSLALAVFVILMLAATAGAVTTWIWAYAREPWREPQAQERRARAIALSMTLPATMLSLLGVLFLLRCAIRDGEAALLSGRFLYAFFVALPVAGLVALLSFLSFPIGAAWRLLHAVRALALLATCLVWFGMVVIFFAVAATI